MKAHKIIISVLIIASLFVIACTENATETATGQDNAVAVQPGEPGHSLADIIASKTSEYLVQYRFKATGVDEADASVSSIILAIKGKDKMKMKVVAEKSGFSYTAYRLGDKSYVCSSQDGTEQCFTMQLPESSGSYDAESVLENTDVNSAFSGTRTIAGTTAFCFKASVSSEEHLGTGEICVSKEGIPLYIKSEADGKTAMEMEAVEYSTSVPDSEFVPPAGEVQDISGLVQQYQQQAGN